MNDINVHVEDTEWTTSFQVTVGPYKSYQGRHYQMNVDLEYRDFVLTDDWGIPAGIGSTEWDALWHALQARHGLEDDDIHRVKIVPEPIDV